MTKQLTEYTQQELEEKILNIKAEREKTANALRRYEEELERRKQKVPLGVPDEGNFCVNFNNNICEFNNKHSVEEMEYNIFNTSESAEKHAEMLLAWRMALVENSEGKPIDIEVLSPLLQKGWVAMDEDRRWCWYSKKPTQAFEEWVGTGCVLSSFNIKPTEDWRNSLMECGL